MDFINYNRDDLVAECEDGGGFFLFRAREKSCTAWKRLLLFPVGGFMYCYPYDFYRGVKEEFESYRLGGKRIVFTGESSEFYSIYWRVFLITVLTAGLWWLFGFAHRTFYTWVDENARWAHLTNQQITTEPTLCCGEYQESRWVDDVHDSCKVMFYSIQMSYVDQLKLAIGTILTCGLGYGVLYRHYRVAYLSAFAFDGHIIDLHGSTWQMVCINWKSMVLSLCSAGLWHLLGYAQLEIDSYADKQLKWRHKATGGKDFELSTLHGFGQHNAKENRHHTHQQSLTNDRDSRVVDSHRDFDSRRASAFGGAERHSLVSNPMFHDREDV